MNKRTRQKGEFVPSTMVPAVALTRLSAEAYYLLAFLLEHHETVIGPLDELRHDGRMRRAGLSRDGIRRAAQELIDAGFYSYRDVRQSDGRVARDQWVTEVPHSLPVPEPTRRPVPAAKTRLTSGNASSSKPLSARRAETHPGDTVSAGRARKRPQDPLSVPPAETVPETGIVAGRARKRPQDPLSVPPAETVPETGIVAGRARKRPQDPLSVPPAETVPETGIVAGRARKRPQDPLSVPPAETVPETGIVAGRARKRPQDPLSVPPAETGSLDGLYAGQDGFGVARASSFRETDRQTTPLPPKADVPGQRGSDEGEDPAAQPQDAYVDWAWKILETIDGVPMRRNGGRTGSALAAAVAQRLAAGRPEQEIRERIRSHLPQQGIIDTYAFALRRVEAIPLRPPGEGRTRESDRGFGETAAKFDALGLPLYARPSDNPDALDPQAAGGWRNLIRERGGDVRETPKGRKPSA